MKYRSLAHQIVLACCLVSLMGCIEYRFDHLAGQERYLGWGTTRPNLDPKIGPKGKLYLLPQSRINPYLGGKFSKRRLTGNIGVIYYWSSRSSLELGIRSLLFETDNHHFGDRTGGVNWDDNDDKYMFYFGGRINF